MSVDGIGGGIPSPNPRPKPAAATVETRDLSGLDNNSLDPRVTGVTDILNTGQESTTQQQPTPQERVAQNLDQTDNVGFDPRDPAATGSMKELAPSPEFGEAGTAKEFGLESPSEVVAKEASPDVSGVGLSTEGGLGLNVDVRI